MDLDFSFTLRTSIRPTVEKKPKSKPLSGQNKRVLSTTRRKHWQGLFVNNEIDLQQSEKKSEKYIDARKSSAKQVIPAIFSEEVKENLDPSCFVMNTDEKRSNFRKCKKNNSEQLTASSVTNHNSEQVIASCATNSEQLNASSVTNHNSSGEKDFIELGKVSLRKHQRTLYKRNIKDGKLFYKRNVIANFTEFIEKSFASNNSSESRKLSDKVIENGLRISERCQVDRSALNVDENGDEDENDLFSGSLSSSSSRLEKPAKKNKEKSVLDLENDLFSGSISSSSSRLAKKNKDKSVLDGSISSNSSRLAQENKDESVLEGNPGNFLDQSLIVSSPSLLSSSLLGCRPLSNGKKRPGDFVDDCRPRKRSFNTTESVSFENLKTKVKSIMSSDDFSSPSPKPLKTSTDSFIDCISASDSEEHDCSHHLVSKISSTRKSSRKHLANGNINEHDCSPHINSTGKSKISNSSTRKSSRKHENGINGNGIDCSNTATRRKSLRNKCVESNENESCVEHEQVGSNNDRFDTKKSLRRRCVESNGNESANGVEHKQVDSNNRNKFETKNNSGCNRLKANDFHDKDVNNTSGTKQNFDNSINEVKSTRSSRRKSSKHFLDPTEVCNNVEVDESYTSVDMFDDSRLSEVYDNNGDKLTSSRSRRSKEIRINGDRGSVGIALDSSGSNRGKKISGVGITSEGPV
ncbi:hypothetical protein LSTR_LSTR000510 [Laodelphax striatellus]|uniref:Uncharacterized protein n=1 Tax=Laodelphax striatellus TaxID=195883 RepID=A0A482WYZ3_LAOST|nr:hypothetical protein LSTR_LSTR000510 [Laodelphax striatellus]